MKQHTLYFFLLFILALQISAQTQNEQSKERIDSIANGLIQLKFELVDEVGENLNFSYFKGKFVVLDIWATWCKPCIQQSPYFEKRKKELANDSIVFLSISIDESLEKWKKYCKNKKVIYDRYWIGSKTDNQAFALTYDLYDIGDKEVWASGIPRFVLINPDGYVLEKQLYYPSDRAFKKIIKKHF